jgi:hypothetical protein
MILGLFPGFPISSADSVCLCPTFSTFANARTSLGERHFLLCLAQFSLQNNRQSHAIHQGGTR